MNRVGSESRQERDTSRNGEAQGAGGRRKLPEGSPETAAVGGDFALSDPRVQELDRAASQACVGLCEAIETATRAGVPAEIVAKYTNKPLSEVRLIIEEMRNLDEAAGLPPQPLDRSPDQGLCASRGIHVTR